MINALRVMMVAFCTVLIFILVRQISCSGDNYTILAIMFTLCFYGFLCMELGIAGVKDALSKKIG
jgi:hypothetical protein